MTERDAAILDSILAYRTLSAQMVARLFGFSPAVVRGKAKINSNCQKRLRLLTQHKFLIARPHILSKSLKKPLVYWIGQRGADYIALERGVVVSDLDWLPRQHEVGQWFLDHLLSCNDFRITLTMAAAQRRLDLLEWRDEKTLKREHASEKVAFTTREGKVEQTTLEPDGYFVLDLGDEIVRAFFEADRATVTGASETSRPHDWARRIAVYQAAFQAGGFYERHYGTRFGLVLTVTTGQKRLENLKRITEEQGGKSRFRFAIFDNVTPETILTAPIWAVASWEGLYTFTDTQPR